MTGPWRTPRGAGALAGVMGPVLLSLWPLLRGDRQGEPIHLALLASPAADAVRDPQQLAQRTAGSRSPPHT
ncbi:hypothetical protein [Nonomuraea sp. NPDC050202]|uniref:hypothetical protein n=1 Tax=Nonomuraea sp. NPDC050202 TaxID=3155035 RepID=UPI0033E13F8D